MVATCIIDASTAFRTDDNWVYGLPELNKGQRERLRNTKRIAVPGCHASAFVLLIRPLVEAGIVPADYPVTAFSLMFGAGRGNLRFHLQTGRFVHTQVNVHALHRCAGCTLAQVV
ncbi:hypothetical protein AAU61_22705 [Desulfocarbo indianensis]|nr:hypothetical protein AAU61_22705 [Desulfocarbo indianensis]